MTHHIFLSYRRTDQVLAGQLVKALEAQGVDVWWDQEIEGGQDWREAIVEGLTASQALVILFSEACNESKQLKKELAMADTLDKEIIPVLIEDTKPKGHYLYELAARNWLQIHPDPQNKLDGLATRLARELGTPAGAMVSAPRAESMQETAAPAPSHSVQSPSSAPVPQAPVPMTPPEEPALQADTVEKVVSAAKTVERENRQRRDFLPFKWYEVAFFILAIGGFAWFGSQEAQLGVSLDTIDVVAMAWDTVMIFLMAIMVYAAIVFPIRYYFRRRRVWRAVRAYALSMLAIALVLGVVIGLHPTLADETVGSMENLLYSVIGSVVIVAVLSVIAFSIYGLLHFQRTVRSFNNNVETIT